MENENLDLDVKPAGNKDLWLFLIIVDIIFMCVFGFFLYKHFSASLFNGSRPAAETAAPVRAEEQLPVVDVEAVMPIETTSVAAEPEKAPEAVVTVEQTPAVVASALPAPAEEKPAAEAKKSVIVAVNPKSSKYRRVTFRWFGEGEKVAIVSGFTMSKPQALKKKNGFWETTLSIAPGTYKFLYIVDGENMTDPYSEEKDGRSVVVIE